MHNDIHAWLAHRDEAAARRLMEALHPQVARIAQNHLPRGGEVADLTQEVFVQFFKTLHRYDPARPLENWVSRLALNVCLHALRSRRRRPEWRWSDLSAGEQAVVAEAAHGPEAMTAPAGDGRELLARLMETLGAEDRVVLTLLYLEERSVKDVQALTGWSGPLVKVRAYRAKRKLRHALAALEAEGKKSAPPV